MKVHIDPVVHYSIQCAQYRPTKHEVAMGSACTHPQLI